MQAWLDAALDYIPEWLDHQMRQSEQPGCMMAIAHNGRIVLERAYGHANAATKARLTPRHRFRAASHSKTFTAAGIMRLREDGRLGLDDPVGRYVQGLYKDVARITIGQLLSHGGGLIRDGEDAGHWQDRRPFTSRSELRDALAVPAVLEPSMQLKYSNFGFGLLGLVIEAVTGEDFKTWIAREVIAAAKLRNTQPDGPPPARKLFANGHSNKVLLGHRLPVPADNCTEALAAAAGIITTAGDLARFFASLDPEAKTSVLTKASRREMIRRQWQDTHAVVETHYGLGTMRGKTGEWEWVGHSGGFQGCTSRTVFLPGRDLAISVLTNAVDGPAAAWSDGIIHILRNFQTRGAPSDTTKAWTGRWWSLWGTVDLVPTKDHVVVAVPGAINPFAGATEIKVADKNSGWIETASGYGSKGEGVRLVRGRTGRIREVWLAGSRLLSEKAVKAEVEKRYGG